MSLESSFIVEIGILAIAALLFSLLFTRLRLPVVSGQILAGVIVGPNVLKLVTDPLVINAMSELGVILLLFVLGLELDPRELRRLIPKLGAMTAVEVLISFFTVFLVLFYTIHSFDSSLIVAVALAFASTAIIGRILLDREVGKGPDRTRQVLVGLLVLEDIVAVVFLALIPAISGSISPRSSLLLLGEIGLGGIALVIVSYLAGTYIVPRVINYFASFELESEEIPFLFSLGLGILFGALAAYFGFSPAIGSFMIGLSLRGKYSKFVSKEVRPIRDLFLVLFFVSIGTLIDPLAAFSTPLILVGVIALAIVSKLAGAYVAGLMTSTGLSASMFSLWLMPRGEFSLIIAQSAFADGVISSAYFSVVGIAVLVTSLLGPILVSMKTPRAGKTEFPLRPKEDS